MLSIRVGSSSCRESKEPTVAETLEEKLAKIERADKAILNMFKDAMQPGADMHMSDFVLIGVAKRTLALSEGFRGLIEARNFTCAAALVRMQLDTALRIFAAGLVHNSEDYARAVFMGEPIDKIKDRDGKRLTDSYLAKRLNEQFPWVEGVYKELCGLVHFTSRHIFAGAAKLNEEERIVHFQISGKDPPRPDSDYFEIVDAYYETMSVTASFALAWQKAKSSRRQPQPPAPDAT